MKMNFLTAYIIKINADIIKFNITLYSNSEPHNIS